jgi:hypothetical protein
MKSVPIAKAINELKSCCRENRGGFFSVPFCLSALASALSRGDLSRIVTTADAGADSVRGQVDTGV